MSEVQKKKKSRKWIVKALIIFLVVMGILTFFSNTIMNMTLTQVSTMQIYGSTLSNIVRASGTVKAKVTHEIKAPGDVTIENVEQYLYSNVEEGDVLATLKTPENQEDLEAKKKELEELLKSLSYDKRTPSERTDYYYLETALADARKKASEAAKQLDQVRNKTSLIAQKKSEISNIQKKIDKAGSDKATLESQKTEMEGKRDEASEALGPLNEALLAAQVELSKCITDPEDPMFDPDRLAACTEAVKNAQVAVDNMNAMYSDYSQKVTNIINSINAKDADVTRYTTDKTKAEEELQELELLPELQDAQRALNDANHEVTTKEKELSNARINDGINSDKKQDTAAENDAKIAKLEDEIAKLEEFYSITEIKAPSSGYLTLANVTRGQQVMKDEVLFEIAELDSGLYVDCSVGKDTASQLYVGAEVRADYCDHAEVEQIRPDPNDPMNSSVVRIAVDGEWLIPGNTTITCTMSTSNRQYENVVPKGAVQKDSEGSFIYILVTKNSPLGERYIARKVPVTVLAEDSTSCAIEGPGVNFAYCIVRTEKPITNGEQVRLAQGEAN